MANMAIFLNGKVCLGVLREWGVGCGVWGSRFRV